MSQIMQEINKRRTFAIISHPDAGKTTLTEKLLLFGGAIQLAGTVKGRKASRHATSDWMELEKQRGISVTTSVMQFLYDDCVFNLLDTPGHADFSEDTYRTLTAVDCALMVIDAAKGVEERTIKLLEVCRLRNTPILTFINKMDRETREPIELLDEIEDILKIHCAPITWPIGMGKSFKGIYHFGEDKVYRYQGNNAQVGEDVSIDGLISNEAREQLGDNTIQHLRDDIELVRGASHPFSHEQFLQGDLTPVFFGSAMNSFGIRQLLDMFSQFAPSPQPRTSSSREVVPSEEKFTGFVFKVQANMDPNHRDRVAFLRICSGQYKKGMKVQHVRIKRTMTVSNAMTFMAGSREHAEEAFAGDILGLPNHGTISIGDTFTEGEGLKFTGIPSFAPELFKRVVLKDPLKMKALQKGLTQLSEEGAAQVFKPLNSNDLILGAIGVLQFDVVAYRLLREYNVECVYQAVNLNTVRWVECRDEKTLAELKHRAFDQLALDGGDYLVYLAPTRVNLDLTQERFPDVKFHATREL